MIEKLLENWLDSASERSYQAVFVQMLSGMGYRVVHSTRHTALEYGKDILAIGPDGVGHAYQLKGNPGSKLGLSQFRSEIQPQLVQLMSQSVVYPGFPSEPHKAHLVSNGYFEEEVQRAVDDLNRGPYPSKVTLLSRGDMLDWCKSMGASLWPSELSDVRMLLELVLSHPTDLLPSEKLAELIGKTLSTDPTDTRLVKTPEMHRMITSAALLTGIATAHFAEAKNHFAVATAWGLLAVMVIAATEKHAHPLSGAALETVELAERAALDALTELWEEIKNRKHLVEGNGMADPEVYGWRLGLLLGALSCLAIANDQSEFLGAEKSSELKEWLTTQHRGISFWGEGAIVNLMPWLIYIRKHDPTARPDYEIANVANNLISTNQHGHKSPLANPYYDFETIARQQLGLPQKPSGQGMNRDTFAGSAYTAEPLMHLLVRTNLKSQCRALWPDFTRLGHRRFSPAAPWHYCLLKVHEGIDETYLYQSTYEWRKLKIEATATTNTGNVPDSLISRGWLLPFWWLVAPHRFNTETSRIVVNSQIPGWGT